MSAARPDLILVAGAMCNVDLCEAEPGACERTNTQGPMLVAEYARAHGRASSCSRRIMAAGQAFATLDMAGKRVLLPQADIARDTVAAGLRDAGANVDTVVAYRTVLPEARNPEKSGNWHCEQTS